MKGKFFFSSLVVIFGTNIINLFNYIYHFVMGRMLGPSSYGELAALISLVGLLLIIPSSFGLALTRMVATESKNSIKHTLNKIIKMVLIFCLMFSVVFFSLAPIIAQYLKVTNIWSVVIAGSFFTFSMLGFIYKSILQGLLKFSLFVSATIGETGVKLFLGVLLVYLGYGSFGALGAISLGAILGLVMAKFFVGDFFKGGQKEKISNKYISDLFLFSVPITVYTISQTSLFSADLILVKHFFQDFDAGLYAALSSLGKIIFFGAGPVVMVMFPMVSQKFSNKEKYHKIFFLSLIFTLSVCSMMLALFYFFPEHIIKFSVGSPYLKVSNILFLFGVFMSLVSLANLLINFQLALKRTKVVILPALAAISQIVFINYFHSSLYQVILVSIISTICLLTGLIIFSLRR